jgi:hypothetical protein
LSDQLVLGSDAVAVPEPPAPDPAPAPASSPHGRVRVAALAGTLVGYVLPGFGGERRIPKKVMEAAEEVAARALADLDAAVRKGER